MTFLEVGVIDIKTLAIFRFLISRKCKVNAFKVIILCIASPCYRDMSRADEKERGELKLERFSELQDLSTWGRIKQKLIFSCLMSSRTKHFLRS